MIPRCAHLTTATTLALSACVLVPAASAVAATASPTTTDSSLAAPADRISFSVLPDTQFYSRYATAGTGDQYMTRYGSEPFLAQTQWIADNDQAYDVAFTMHLGDVVDRANQPEEWAVADEAMSVLEQAGAPYSVLAGNHDVGAGASDTDAVSYETYVSHFSAERAAQQSTFLERDPSGASEAHLVAQDGTTFLVLAISWQSQQETLDWANRVIAAHPGVPTILTSHQILNVDEATGEPLSTAYGERLWNDVIAPNDQVFLTLNGHHHGATEQVRTNDAGHPVHQILMDHQMAYMGGNGYMGLLEFDLTHGKIYQTTFSPWVMQKPAETLVAEDQALLDGRYQTFTRDFDFAGRFPTLTIGAADETSSTAALRDWITSTFQAPTPRPAAEPANESDYPVVEGTVAHWRMPDDVTDGQVAPVGSRIEDIAAGNTLTRAPLNEPGVTGAEESDVTWSTDHHHLSSDAGSVCFDDAGRTGNTASYFTTADGADVNDETFPNGFTLEAFIKIDPDFTPEENAWMQWLTRDGQRENLPGYVDTEGDEPPVSWAFSNLREVQLSVVDSQAPVATETSAWSGEIVGSGQWHHLAAVNDPTTKTTTMYVDGVPVLRNATETVGIAHDEAQRWVFGAGSYDGQRQSGFLGCLGETRMVDRPLAQNQWLTSRAETTTPVDPAPVEPTPVAHPERMLTRGDAVALVRDRTGVDLTGILADQRGGLRPNTPMTRSEFMAVVEQATGEQVHLADAEKPGQGRGKAKGHSRHLTHGEAAEALAHLR